VNSLTASRSELHRERRGALTVHLAAGGHAAAAAGGRDGTLVDGLAAQPLQGGCSLGDAQRVVAVVVAALEGAFDCGAGGLSWRAEG
jgi:hypothetical protein